MSGGGRISAEDGKWQTRGVFSASKLDETGAANYFDTDQAKTDTVTLSLTGTGASVCPARFRNGIIRRIHYRLKPTNAVTYTLRLWRRGGVTGNYEANRDMMWESASAQASDTDYDHGELAIPFRLNVQSKIWYSIDWSGTPGTTQGFVYTSGEHY